VSYLYETATGFAADVLHYLADEPVLACPPAGPALFWLGRGRMSARLASPVKWNSFGPAANMVLEGRPRRSLRQQESAVARPSVLERETS
jgi:hypothetical protein